MKVKPRCGLPFASDLLCLSSWGELMTITGTVAPPKGLPSSGVLGISALIGTPGHTQTHVPSTSETLLHADGAMWAWGAEGF